MIRGHVINGVVRLDPTSRLPEGAEAFGKELAKLAPELAKSLPRGADDIDELANQPHVMGSPEPPRQAPS